MISLLIWLLALAIVVVVLFYIINLLELPHPIPTIAKLIIGLIALLLILQSAMPLLGSHVRLSDARTIQLTLS